MIQYCASNRLQGRYTLLSRNLMLSDYCRRLFKSEQESMAHRFYCQVKTIRYQGILVASGDRKGRKIVIVELFIIKSSLLKACSLSAMTQMSSHCLSGGTKPGPGVGETPISCTAACSSASAVEKPLLSSSHPHVHHIANSYLFQSDTAFTHPALIPGSCVPSMDFENNTSKADLASIDLVSALAVEGLSRDCFVRKMRPLKRARTRRPPIPAPAPMPASVPVDSCEECAACDVLLEAAVV